MEFDILHTIKVIIEVVVDVVVLGAVAAVAFVAYYKWKDTNPFL
jgi:hypothetical protein